MNVSSKNTFYDLRHYDNKAAYDRKKEDVLKETAEKLKEDLKNFGFESEEERMNCEKKINEKVKSGEKLTEKEMNYIQRTNPNMYMRIKRIQMQRELLNKQLKHCRSKKEVEEVYNQAMAGISEKDPDKQLVMKAYENVTKEFKHTNEYRTLP